MNIELGKKIFFKCYGNMFTIQKEYGKEYKKCMIPKKYENEWLYEIQKQLYETINNTSGRNRYLSFLKLCDIVSLNNAIELTIKLLNINIDYYERLLYTEYLKQLNKKVGRYELIEEINKNKMILDDNISLLKEHSKLYFVLDENKIKERINRL